MTSTYRFIHKSFFKLSLLSFVLVLCTSLHTSTTHSQHILKHYILKSEVEDAYKGLWPAAKNGSTDATFALVELATINADVFWLEKAASLQNIKAQLSLVDLATTSQEKIYWWQQAAKNGDSASQFELALLENSYEQRIRYLNEAAEAGYTPAIIALAKIMYDANDAENALLWLRKAAQFDASSQFKLAKMLWAQSQRTEAASLFQEAAERTDKNDGNFQDYAYVSANIEPQKITALYANGLPMPDNCSQKLQFVATSLESAVQAKRFERALRKDKRLSNLTICSNPIVWLEADQLRCKLTNNRQVCDLSILAKQSFLPNYSHLVLFLPSGTAYVQNAIMHLDQADTYSVFVHELAHFVGFVDEYAVAETLAQQYCDDTGAPNLILDEDIYVSDTFLKWQGHAESLRAQIKFDKQNINEEFVEPIFEQAALQIAPTRTCSKLGIKAVKPSSELTFLEYHDTQNIPPIYLAIWQQQLKQQHQDITIAAYFKNIAFEKGLMQQAEYWSRLAN